MVTLGNKDPADSIPYPAAKSLVFRRMISWVLFEEGGIGELLEKVGRSSKSKAARSMLHAAYHELSRILSVLLVLCVESLADDATQDRHRVGPGRHKRLSQKIVELVCRRHR